MADSCNLHGNAFKASLGLVRGLDEIQHNGPKMSNASEPVVLGQSCHYVAIEYFCKTCCNCRLDWLLIHAQDGILEQRISSKLILVQAPMAAEWLDLLPQGCNSGFSLPMHWAHLCAIHSMGDLVDDQSADSCD